MAVCCISVCLAETESIKGRPLGEVLQLFKSRGVEVTYSSNLVDVSVLVPIEPKQDTPLAQLEEVTRSVGLKIVAGPGQRWLIVKGDAPDDAIEDAAQDRRMHRAINFTTTVEVTPSRREVNDKPLDTRSVTRDDVLSAPTIGGDLGRAIEKLPGAPKQTLQK